MMLETDLIIFAPPVDSDLIEPDLVAGRWLEPGDQQRSGRGRFTLDRLPRSQAG